MSDQPKDIIDCAIIGAGWAGLACAVELTKQGLKPIVLEASSYLGGRARSIDFAGTKVDNGQHIMLEAYTNVLDLNKFLDLYNNRKQNKKNKYFSSENFYLNIINNLNLKIPNLPVPFNLIYGILTAKKLKIIDKLSIIKAGFFIYKNNNKNNRNKNIKILEQDCSVQYFLIKILKQTYNSIKQFWEPIVVSALSTPIDQASARVFLKLMQESFFKSSKHIKWLFINKDLSSVIPDLAEKYLEENGIKIYKSCRVKSIELLSENYSSIYNNINYSENNSKNEIINYKYKIITNKKTVSEIEVKKIIMAVPPRSLINIISNSIELPKIFTKLATTLSNFKYQLIITVYYKILDLNGSLNNNNSNKIWGLFDKIGHFVFVKKIDNYNKQDESICNNQYIISVVISAAGEYVNCDNKELADKIYAELITEFKKINIDLTIFSEYKVIKEKLAAFSCETNVDSYRPDNDVNISNFYLAGDYTNTGLPATLEGAVISGLECARIFKCKFSG